MSTAKSFLQSLWCHYKFSSGLVIALILMIAVLFVLSGCGLVDSLSNLGDSIGDLVRGALK